MYKPEPVLAAKAICGECPVWEHSTGLLHWIDVHARQLHRFNPATGMDEVWLLPEKPGSFALRASGGYLVALESGIYQASLFGGALDKRFDPEPDQPGNRFNDGRCDIRGRFWVGSLPVALDRAAGSLYRCDQQGVERVREGFIVPNGLAFSPAGDVIYYADSRARTVWHAEFDVEAGSLANERVFVRFAEAEGRPDGAAVDESGCYWIAHVTGGLVSRYTPDGRRDLVIEMPVSRPTMCAFGGPDLRTLFITSGTEHLTDVELGRQPLAGAIFALRTDVAGMPEPLFLG